MYALIQNIRTDYDLGVASCSKCDDISITWVQSSRDIRRTTHLHLNSKLENEWSYTSITTCFYDVNLHNFTFTLSLPLKKESLRIILAALEERKNYTAINTAVS
jgi:hypothetical protein